MVVGMPNPRARRLALAAAVAAGAAGAALAMALSGCSADVEPTAAPTPSTSSDAAPIFASDEEALTAAVAAYEAYAEASRTIVADGFTNPDRVDAFVTDEYAPTLHEEFESFSSAGYRFDGESTTDSTSLVSRSESSGIAEVSIYLCQDVTNVQVLDSNGNNVTPSDREDRVPSQAFLVSSDTDPRTLLVNEIVRWSGEDFC